MIGRAKSDYDYHEYEHQRQTRIEAERLTDARMKSLFYRVERIDIRCARIACGLALAFDALLIFDSKTDVCWGSEIGEIQQPLLSSSAP